jgi:hypothetical protein
MSFTLGHSVLRALSLGALTIGLSAAPAHAQGRCMQRQTGQSSLRTQSYALPQQNYLQADPYALQLYALQQYALQQYALQAQLNAFQQSAVLPRQSSAQPNGLASADVLRSQLDDLQDYIADQQQNGQFSPSRLRTLRQQERALTKQLRAAEKRAASRQRTQAQLPPRDTAE